MGMKNKISEFGKRLAHFRKAKGLTQKQIGEQVGVSYRVIAYYEGETAYPPAHLIIPLAKALGISTDELLGVKESKKEVDMGNPALRRRLKAVESLPKRDQQAILQYITLIVKSRTGSHKTA